MKEYYNNVAQNPPQYYGKNLDDFLELFINEYATDDEIIKEGYPRLRKHIFTWLSNKLDSDDNVKTMLENRWKITEEAEARVAAAEEAARVAAEEEAAKEYPRGGKRNSKSKSKKVVKKPVVSQKKQSIYKEILGKQMKIYKMPDSRKEYVKYKGELLHISDYKDLMKQKAIAKTKTKVTKVTKVTKETKETQQKAIAKTKTTKATKVMQQKAKAKAKK